MTAAARSRPVESEPDICVTTTRSGRAARRRLWGTPFRLLLLLRDRFPQPATYPEVCEILGCSRYSGAVYTAAKRLRRLGLVETGRVTPEDTHMRQPRRGRSKYVRLTKAGEEAVEVW